MQRGCDRPSLVAAHHIAATQHAAGRSPGGWCAFAPRGIAINTVAAGSDGDVVDAGSGRSGRRRTAQAALRRAAGTEDRMGRGNTRQVSGRIHGPCLRRPRQPGSLPPGATDWRHRYVLARIACAVAIQRAVAVQNTHMELPCGYCNKGELRSGQNRRRVLHAWGNADAHQDTVGTSPVEVAWAMHGGTDAVQFCVTRTADSVGCRVPVLGAHHGAATAHDTVVPVNGVSAVSATKTYST